MRNFALGCLALVATGCTVEQGFSEDPSQDWQSNPPELPGGRVTDEYVQTSPTKADVLFVISNWWSMETAYEELVDSFDEMLSVFVGSGIDFHIGVISTDTDHADDNGKLKQAYGYLWIDEDNPQPVQTFAQMATMDASGCVGPRRPRDATYMALETQRAGHNAGFRRQDASMHTVFVSDYRDDSRLLSLDEWIDWYDGFTDTPEIDTLSTIVDFIDEDNRFATQVIGGTSHPIQDQPWANVLQQIGVKAQGFKTEYFLTRLPVEGTVEVTVVVNQTELAFAEDEDWWYDSERNSIHFIDYMPPEKSQIRLSYEPR
jgi:hypothetical protein